MNQPVFLNNFQQSVVTVTIRITETLQQHFNKQVVGLMNKAKIAEAAKEITIWKVFGEDYRFVGNL